VTLKKAQIWPTGRAIYFMVNSFKTTKIFADLGIKKDHMATQEQQQKS